MHKIGSFEATQFLISLKYVESSFSMIMDKETQIGFWMHKDN